MNILSQRSVQLMALVTILILVAASAIYWVADRTEAYEINGRVISPLAQAPALDLTDQNGNPFTLLQESGKVALVFFGTTRCPDPGPTTLNDFAIVKNDLGDDGYKADFIFVTFDPKNDTQERMREDLASVDPSFIGLRGNDEQTTQVLDAYGVTVERTGQSNSSTDCQFDSNARVYLIDKDGKLHVIYLPGTDPLKIAQDVKYLVGN